MARQGKSETAFRTISEVADELQIPQHVLRFWETKFAQVKPMKRGGGRRYYRPDDVALLRRIRDLLYHDGYTIRGVQKLLREQGVRSIVAATPDVSGAPATPKAPSGGEDAPHEDDQPPEPETDQEECVQEDDGAALTRDDDSDGTLHEAHNGEEVTPATVAADMDSPDPSMAPEGSGDVPPEQETTAGATRPGEAVPDEAEEERAEEDEAEEEDAPAPPAPRVTDSPDPSLETENALPPAEPTPEPTAMALSQAVAEAEARCEAAEAHARDLAEALARRTATEKDTLRALLNDLQGLRALLDPVLENGMREDADRDEGSLPPAGDHAADALPDTESLGDNVP